MMTEMEIYTKGYNNLLLAMCAYLYVCFLCSVLFYEKLYAILLTL